jgi:glycosyltransferase involved in cell wall biosynthesis
MDSNIQISIIICTIGNINGLRYCLESIDSQNTIFDNYEIIVVDQSGDNTIKELCLKYPHLIWLPCSSKGLSLSRNVGIKKASGRWLAFIDDDAWLDNSYLIKLSAALKNKTTSPSVYIVDALRSDTNDYFVNNFHPSNILKIEKSPAIIYSICSISIILAKEVFIQIGDFDTMLGVGAKYPSCEETDLLLRAWEKDYPFQYLPGIRVYHPPSIVSYSTQRMKQGYTRGQGHGALYRKHLWTHEKQKTFFILKMIMGVSGSLIQVFNPKNIFKKSKFHLYVFLGKIRGLLSYSYE